MLPPKELNTTCLRCKADMPVAERYCGKCGADRELELAVAGELDPAIASLERWLAALGVISLVLGWLMYSDLRQHYGLTAGQAMGALWPTYAMALGLLALYLVARIWPLGTSLAAMILFVGNWGLQAIDMGATAFTPGIALAVRIIFLLVLCGAVQAGWRARVMRARAAENFPTAVARERRS
jgi:hypothetical protein